MMLNTTYPTLFMRKDNVSKDFLDLNIYNNTGEGHREMIYSGFCYIKPYEDDEHHKEVVAENNDVIESETIKETTKHTKDPINDLGANTLVQNTTQELYAINYETKGNDDSNIKQTYKIDSKECKGYEEDEYACEMFLTELTTMKSLENSWDNQFTEEAVIESSDQLTTLELDCNNLNETIIFSEDELSQDFQEIEIVEEEINIQQLEDYDEHGTSQNQSLNHSWESNLIDETKTEACEQLMLLDTDCNKLTNTIIYTGDEKSGITIQEIVVNDPDVECRIIKTRAKKRTTPGQNKKKYQCSKCKQCFNTMPSFKLHLVEIIVKNRKGVKVSKKPESQVNLSCEECGKIFHCPKKLEKHNSGHGNPDRECEICAKVFASKSTLRTHGAIHRRKYQCQNCPKSFSKQKDYANHQARTHCRYDCTICSFSTKNFKLFEDHKCYHESTKNQTFKQDTGNTKTLNQTFKLDTGNNITLNQTFQENTGNIESDIIIIEAKDFDEQSSFDSGVNLYSEEISSNEPEADYLCLDGTIENVDSTIFDNIENDLSYTENAAYSYNIDDDELFNSIDNVLNDTPLASFEDESGKDTDLDFSPDSYETIEEDYNIASASNIEEANNIMKQVRTDSLFFSDTKYKRMGDKKNKKTCNICSKSFDRMTDLKRHVIEHIVHCTLAKNPTNNSGTLALTCEFCDGNTFDKIETYKAHLRQHAKLTNYKCILCNKSFSDSSNFAKHKKVHNNDFFQCDLCLRKFTSKKMIIKHMEVHKRTEPKNCVYCGQQFFFESILKKHYKTKHSKSIVYKCFFCSEVFQSLKRKWDHEWQIHNSRKTAIDCMLCKKQFRKYSDLKKHCLKIHKIAAPKLKSLNQKD